MDHQLSKRRLCLRALENLEDCAQQTIRALADTDDPERAATLSDRLSYLHMGVAEVKSELDRLRCNATI